MTYFLEKEGRIADLLATVGDKETKVELQRQNLNSIYEFTVISLFDYLDTNWDGSLNEIEIQDFAI